jgi:hypothetical protein
MTPAMDAEGLMELITMLPRKCYNVTKAKRAKEAHDQLREFMGAGEQ